jgi:hypothetical protein
VLPIGTVVNSAGEPQSLVGVARKFKTRRQPHGSDQRPEEEYLLPAFDRGVVVAVWADIG